MSDSVATSSTFFHYAGERCSRCGEAHSPDEAKALNERLRSVVAYPERKP